VAVVGRVELLKLQWLSRLSVTSVFRLRVIPICASSLSGCQFVLCVPKQRRTDSGVIRSSPTPPTRLKDKAKNCPSHTLLTLVPPHWGRCKRMSLTPDGHYELRHRIPSARLGAQHRYHPPHHILRPHMQQNAQDRGQRAVLAHENWKLLHLYARDRGDRPYIPITIVIIIIVLLAPHVSNFRAGHNARRTLS
jgi:hypothetical protein